MRDLRDDHTRTAFTLSAIFGAMLAVVVAAVAVPASTFFGEPRLRSLLPVIGVTFLFRGVELTPNDMLIRAFRFRDYYLSSTIATLTSIVAAIAAATAGLGPWALVVMMLVESAIATVLAWVFAIRARVWLPRIGLTRPALKDLTGFSLIVTCTRLLSYGRSNLDNLVVGRFLGTTSLGYYSFAYRVMLIPLQRFGEVVAANALPALARSVDDLELLRKRYFAALRYVTAVCAPVMVGVAITAHHAVPLIFGNEWRPAADTVEVLALGGPLLAMTHLTGTLCVAIGKPGRALLLSGAALALYGPAFILGSRSGLLGVAVAFVVATAVISVPELAVAAKSLHIGMPGLLGPILPIGLATLAMAAVAHLTQRHVPATAGNAVPIAAAACTGLLAYATTLRVTAPDLLTRRSAAI
jgi:O-antigen/teichoic acid export membrane protein